MEQVLKINLNRTNSIKCPLIKESVKSGLTKMLKSFYQKFNNLLFEQDRVSKYIEDLKAEHYRKHYHICPY